MHFSIRRNWCIPSLAAILLIAVGCQGLFEDLDDLEGVDADLDLWASEGEFSDYVLLEWERVSGADEYRLYRDGEADPIYSGGATSYEDDEADLPVLTKPDATATADGGEVELTWDASDVEIREQDYEVVAVFDGDDRFHDEATGYRDIDGIDEYEVSRDDNVLATIDGDSELRYVDSELPVAGLVLDDDAASATRGEKNRRVRLDIDGVDGGVVEVDAGADIDYRIVPVAHISSGETIEGEPADVTASREGDVDEVSVDELDITWERFDESEGGTRDDWSEPELITDGDEVYWLDTDLPDSFAPRWYQAVVELEVAEPGDIDSWESERVVGYASCETDADTEFGGGLGSEEAPYLVCAPNHLDALASQVNEGVNASDHFQVQDFDSGVEPFVVEPIGTENNPFSGTFRGDGSSIDGLRIIGDDSGPSGLFGVLEMATIEKIHLEDVYIQSESSTGAIAGMSLLSEITESSASGSLVADPLDGEVYGAGGLVGGAIDSTIEASQASVAVRTHSGEVHAGGLIGVSLENTKIIASFARGHVFALSRVGHAGGLTGNFQEPQSDAIIRDSYATGSVYSNTGGRAGGVVGNISDEGARLTLDSVYSFGAVDGHGAAGPVVGMGADHFDSTGDATRVFYNSDSRCESDLNDDGEMDGVCGAVGTGITTDAMIEGGIDDFGFDFDDTWQLDDYGPPRLAREELPECDFWDEDDGFTTEGTENDPHIICNRDHLEAIEKIESAFGAPPYAPDMGEYFKLRRDIHLGSGEWAPLGLELPTRWSPTFRGVLDGNGHRISHLSSTKDLEHHFAEFDPSVLNLCGNGDDGTDDKACGRDGILYESDCVADIAGTKEVEPEEFCPARGIHRVGRGLFHGIDSEGHVKDLEVTDVHLQMRQNNEHTGAVAGHVEGLVEGVGVTGRIDLSPPSGDGQFGDFCTDDYFCEDGLGCVDGQCGHECQDNDDCPGDDSICDPDSFQCLQACDDDDQCPFYQHCDDQDDVCVDTVEEFLLEGVGGITGGVERGTLRDSHLFFDIDQDSLDFLTASEVRIQHIGGAAGTLLGDSDNERGLIEEVRFTGAIDTPDASSVGGLVGLTSGAVNPNSIPPVNPAELNRCAVGASITADERVGGLSGTIFYGATIDRALSTAAMTVSEDAGGLIGSVSEGMGLTDDLIEITDSYAPPTMTDANSSSLMGESVGRLIGTTGNCQDLYGTSCTVALDSTYGLDASEFDDSVDSQIGSPGLVGEISDEFTVEDTNNYWISDWDVDEPDDIIGEQVSTDQLGIPSPFQGFEFGDEFGDDAPWMTPGGTPRLRWAFEHPYWLAW